MFFQKLNASIKKIDGRTVAPIMLVLGILCLIASLVIWYVQESFNNYALVTVAAGVILVFAFILLDPQRALAWLGSRQARYGLNVVVMVLALAGVLVAVNIITNNQVDAHKWYVDLTENKSLSLAPETVLAMKSLTEPVEARAYMTSSFYNTESTTRLLENYKTESNGLFTFRVIDPTTSPVEAVTDGVTQDGTIVLQMGQRQEKVTVADEQGLTSALLRLTFPGDRKVYFLVGHGEGSSTKSADRDFSKAVALLAKKNYTTGELNLMQTKDVPQDAKAVVIGGPTSPMLPAEIQALKAYLAKGGSVLVMESAYTITEMDPAKDTLAAFLTSDFGVGFQNDLIIDTRATNRTMAFAVPDEAGDFDRISSITSALYVYLTFPSAHSLTLNAEAHPALIFTKLIQIGADPKQVWGETDFASTASDKTPAYDEATDHASPLLLAVSIEDTATQGRLVVIGNTDFATNKNLDVYANSDLFVNSIDWLSHLEKMVNLTPKTQTSRLIVPPFSGSLRVIQLTSFIFIPAAFLVAGLVVWFIRRRHK